MVYRSITGILTGRINLTKNTIKAMLVADAYKPDPKHKTISDVSNEVSGDGYTAGGMALAGKAFNENGVFKASDLHWKECTIKGAARVVVYQEKDGALICCNDLAETLDCTRGPATVKWDAEGICHLEIKEYE